MAKKQGGYWWMLAAAELVVAFAYGCGGQSTVDHGGSLVSEEGLIAFTRITNQTETNIESDIYTINVDGSHERKLTDTPGLDGLPAWSPDGQRIALVSDRDGTEDNGEIYVMNSDGSGLTQLTDDPAYDSFPAWRP